MTKTHLYVLRVAYDENLPLVDGEAVRIKAAEAIQENLPEGEEFNVDLAGAWTEI